MSCNLLSRAVRHCKAPATSTGGALRSSLQPAGKALSGVGSLCSHCTNLPTTAEEEHQPWQTVWPSTTFMVGQDAWASSRAGTGASSPRVLFSYAAWESGTAHNEVHDAWGWALPHCVIFGLGLLWSPCSAHWLWDIIGNCWGLNSPRFLWAQRGVGAQAWSDPCTVICQLEEAKIISSERETMCRKMYLWCGRIVRNWDRGARQESNPWDGISIPRGSTAVPRYPPNMFVGALLPVHPRYSSCLPNEQCPRLFGQVSLRRPQFPWRGPFWDLKHFDVGPKI